MAHHPNRFLRMISEKCYKSSLFNKTSAVIFGVSEKAQVKFANIQSAASEKYGRIAKQVNETGSVIIQDLNARPLQPSSPIPVRVVNLWKWYQQLTGLYAVEITKQQVIRVQDILFKCQEQRRNLNRESSIVNDKLKEIYAELIQTKRDDPKYVQLTIMENKSLQEDARIRNNINLLENEERDLFTELATAIKEYHDSQTMNAQKYKYLSIIASALTAILSLICSLIYNNRRIVEIRKAIAETQRKGEDTLMRNYKALASVESLLNKQSINNNDNIDKNTNSNAQIVYLITGVLVLGFLLRNLFST